MSLIQPQYQQMLTVLSLDSKGGQTNEKKLLSSCILLDYL